MQSTTPAPHSASHTIADYRPCRDTGRMVNLPCGCSDMHYRCGHVSRERDYVSCDGKPVAVEAPTARIEAARDAAAIRNARMFGTDPSWYGR